MENLQKTVKLTGEVTDSPEIRATVNGVFTATFSLDTTIRCRNRAGVYTTRHKRHIVVAREDTAVTIRNAVRKGTHLYVEGKVELKSWEVKGTGEKKYLSLVVIDRFSLVEPAQPPLRLAA